MRVEAPFSVDQVSSMNAYQEAGRDPVGCAGSELVWHGQPVVMLARREGWFCPWCTGVVQDWARMRITDWSWLGEMVSVDDAARILNVRPEYVEGAVVLGELQAILQFKLQDVLTYRGQNDKRTRAAADQLTRMTQEMGLTD